MRVTGPLLDVLEVLLEGLRAERRPYGWSIMRDAKRSGPTVYGVLERLEQQGWVTGSWEDLPERGPRRRCYELTATGKALAESLLAQRRPERRVWRLGVEGTS